MRFSGVAECWADSVPILLWSRARSTRATLDRECGNYHEIDLEPYFQSPLTKWCGTVRNVEEIPSFVANAFQAMTTGRH